jgi:hypothetical protein
MWVEELAFLIKEIVRKLINIAQHMKANTSLPEKKQKS